VTPRMVSAPAEGPAAGLSAAEQAFVLRLQAQGLRYFLDNQLPSGPLVLDRQANHGPRRSHGLVSTAATGMGFVALALAAAEPYRLITSAEAVRRVRRGVAYALRQLPHTRGVVPHFVHSAGGAVVGFDARSTVETAWLVAGALWAADFLGEPALQAAAGRLAGRVDWAYWTAADGRLAHGHNARGRFLGATWDRLNGETVFMYALAAGAARPWPAAGRPRLRTGHDDLGLFVAQYGLDLLDLAGSDVRAAADAATAANYRLCRELAGTFATYRHFWGLSAGDGPGRAASRWPTAVTPRTARSTAPPTSRPRRRRSGSTRSGCGKTCTRPTAGGAASCAAATASVTSTWTRVGSGRTPWASMSGRRSWRWITC